MLKIRNLDIFHIRKFNFILPIISIIYIEVCAILRKEKYRFSYGRKWILTEMENTLIRLPVKTDGTPDWAWMEIYMKSLPYSDKLIS